MKQLLEYIKRIIPKELEVLNSRYQILKRIHMLQPTGRRTVAFSLNFSERLVRSEAEILAEQNLICITAMGMIATEEGVEMLNKLEELMIQLSGISEQEEKVCNLLGVKNVSIAKGNSDEDIWAKKEMGKLASEILKKQLKKNCKVAITGGSTMAEVVEAMHFSPVPLADAVVPARGSVGRTIEIQSDTLVALLAKKLMAKYFLLQIPDDISPETFEKVILEPTVADTISQIKKAEFLLCGIGEGLYMAKKRGISPKVYELCKKKGVVAEILGYYLNVSGEVVYESPTNFILWDEIRQMQHIIAVAGGKKKAESILAVGRALPNCCIVTDEGAAQEMIGLATT